MAENKLAELCSRVIHLSFHALFFLVPLVLCPLNFELFEYNKIMLTYALTILITTAWFLKMIAEKKFSVSRTPLDIPLFLFLCSQIISSFFSIDPHTSLFGYYSRFHGGLLSTTCYLLLYYALVSNYSKSSPSRLFSLFKTILFSGALVATYGLLQHPNPFFQDSAGNWHGIDHQYWLQDVELRIFSTIGQPNWLAAYLGMLVPFSLSLIIAAPLNKTSQKSNQKQISGPKIFYSILAVLFYWSFLYTNSRAGAIGLLAALFSFLVLVIAKYSTLKKIILTKKVLFLLTGIFLIFTALTVKSGQFLIQRFAGIIPLPAKEARETKKTKKAPSLPPPPQPTPAPVNSIVIPTSETGRIRNIVWRGAMEIFKHYPLFGSGVETFAYSYYQYRPQEHNLTTEWDFLYNKAHNEYINFLATTGLVGLFTYLLIIAVFGWWFFKYWRKTTTGSQQLVIVIGLFSSLVGYLIQNIYGFSVVPVALFFFLFPGFCFLLTSTLPTLSFSLSLKPSFRSLLLLIVPATAVFGLFTLGKMWLADTKFARAHQLSEGGFFETSYSYSLEAIKLNPREPLYFDQLAYDAAVLATDREKPEEASLLAEEAVLASQKALTISPLNVTLWKTAIKVLYQLGGLNPEFYQKALEATKVAIDLSPTEPKLPYNLGLVYLQLEETEKAIEAFQKSIKLKPNLRDSRYALAVVYHQQAVDDNDNKIKGDLLKKARNELSYILDFIDPGDVQAQEKLREWEKENS